MVVTVAVVAVLVLIIVFMAVDGGSTSVTNVIWRRDRDHGHHYPYGPGHSSRWGPYYQHGGRTPSNGLLY